MSQAKDGGSYVERISFAVPVGKGSHVETVGLVATESHVGSVAPAAHYSL